MNAWFDEHVNYTKMGLNPLLANADKDPVAQANHLGPIGKAQPFILYGVLLIVHKILCIYHFSLAISRQWSTSIAPVWGAVRPRMKKQSPMVKFTPAITHHLVILCKGIEDPIVL